MILLLIMIQQGKNETIHNLQYSFQQQLNFQDNFESWFEDNYSTTSVARFQPHKQQMDHLYWEQNDQFCWKTSFNPRSLQSNEKQIKKVLQIATKKQIITQQKNYRQDQIKKQGRSMSELEIQQTNLTQECQQKINNFFSLYLNSTLSLKQFAKKNKISQKIVFDFYQKWLSNQLQEKGDKNFQQKISEPLNDNRVMNRQQFLLGIITKNPLLTLVEVSQIADKQKGIKSISKQGRKQISNYNALNKLCNKLIMKKTKLFLISSSRNLPIDYKRRKLYAMRMIELQQNKKKVVFLDQMTINQWTTRDRAWAKEGQSYPNVMINLKKESFLLVSIMNQKGAVKFQIVHGGIIRTKYKSVVNRLLKYASKQQPGEKVLVIHAAVGLQTRNIMKIIGQQKGFQVLILPPYSSKLSPLELWFRQVRDLLKLHKYSNQNELINAVREILFEQLKMKPLPNYYLISQLSLKNALKQQLL